MMSEYRQHLVVAEFKRHWTAKIYMPGSKKPHYVVLRASADEGEAVLAARAKVIIDGLIKENAPP
jgi:hypothetical protein